MKTTKEKIKESINKLDIAKSRLEYNPKSEDVGEAIEIIIDVLNTLENTKNMMIE